MKNQLNLRTAFKRGLTAAAICSAVAAPALPGLGC